MKHSAQIFIWILTVCTACKDDGQETPIDTVIHPPEMPECELLWSADAGVAGDWRWESSRPNQPLVQAGQVIAWALAGDGSMSDVRAFDLDTGEVLWNFSHEHRYRAGLGRFAHSNGQIYVPEWTESNGATLRALSESSGGVAWATRLELYEPQEITADSLGIYAYEQRGDAVWLVALNPEDGALRSEVDLSAYEVVLGPVATEVGVVVFTRRELLLFATETLVPLGNFVRDHDFLESRMPIPVSGDGRVVFWESALGDYHLIALDLRTGESVEFDADGGGSSFAVADRGLYWNSVLNGVYIDGGFQSTSLSDGQEVRHTYDWIVEDGFATTAVSDGALARWGRSSGLLVFDTSSGMPLCSRSDIFPSESYTLLSIADGVIYVPGEESLFAIRVPLP